ncbi:MAG TPA: RelA/SpoT family protein [Bacteroidales bacterium]|nr:RelA/SpoT family protein [Bacteroidales bacterium]HSA44777.1 RelA/SpoT family protein [Bacteroidales bacterium]
MYVIDEAQEKKEILRRYRSLLSAWKVKSEKDKRLVRKAFHFAVEAHKDMRRKSGEPYVYHPLEVARICVQEIGLGTTSIVSALLHDVVEDTDYTLKDIEVMFGEKVARIIDGLTKMSAFVNTRSHSLQAENFMKILLTLSSDVRVILIKLADRLHNMRTLDFLKDEKRLKIASETKYFFAPLAHRMGLFTIKTEMEDLALKQMEPEFYYLVENKIRETEQERNRYFTKFIYPVKKDLLRNNLHCSVKPRVHSVHSIWDKTHNKEASLEEIFDSYVVRFVIDTPHDPEKEKLECWRVYSILTKHYTPKAGTLRDWISVPKTNGYQALHITVMGINGKWVEIQIYTARMEDIAEKGYAAMYKYRQGGKLENAVEEWIRKAKDLLEGKLDSSAEELLDDFRCDLLNEQIVVFTPKGEEVRLPAGACILDFAYSIHSDLGNQCIGAKINHQLAQIGQKLKNGDQVEVLRSVKQRPKTEWLEYTVSSRAKAQIREALKMEKQDVVRQGREILELIFAEAQLEPSQGQIQALFKLKGPEQVNELLFQIGSGTVGQDDIKALLKGKESLFDFLLRPLARIRGNGHNAIMRQIYKTLKTNPSTLLLPESMDEQVENRIASCCHPIPGDDVIGLHINQQSIEIHRTNCPEAVDFMSKFGDRIIKAKWKVGKDIGFLTGIRINAVERKGLVSDITRIISDDFNLNMRSFLMEVSGDISKGLIMVYVHDSKNLNELIDRLRKIQGVILAKRVSQIENTNPLG